MPTAHETAHRGNLPSEVLPDRDTSSSLLKLIVQWLDEAKAADIVTIDLAGKTSIGDFMVIASGGSDRHVGAIADMLREKLKSAVEGGISVEGTETCDWVLVDTGDIIIHVFRPEVREFYNLEKMWSGVRPEEAVAH